jgi:cytochrome c biogenesis protein CcmG/thiol:disulfide interchange protein DsbE
MTARHRLVAATAALAMVTVITACGGDDDASGITVEVTSDDATAIDPAAPESSAAGEAATATAAETAGPDDGPDATVSPDLPEEIAGEVGAMDVVGEPLPVFGPDVTTENDPALGMMAPVIVGQDFDGNTVRVDAAANGPTLVVFLAHWCPHCNNEVPRINELRDDGRFPADLNIVAVSTAVDPTRPNWPPSQWLGDKDWTYPAIADGVDMQEGQFIGATAYGVGGFPFVTLVGADGTVKARWAGEHEPDEFLELVTSNLD